MNDNMGDEQIYDLGNIPIDMDSLKGRDCNGGLDLSSTGDITAFVLMFPPQDEREKYVIAFPLKEQRGVNLSRRSALSPFVMGKTINTKISLAILFLKKYNLKRG